ncbi:LysR family transcriptional regulator [Caballeronia sp. LZ025]|nr:MULTISPECIES: LysR family transcriptional regulator [Caballeronia]MDR5735766.1 LysR family transcriptional regulator [Caballeronia sp. LZ025]
MKGRTGKLGLTVSALSRHIAKLEGELGVSLFERHAGRFCCAMRSAR